VNRFRIEEYDQDEKVFSYGDAADKCFYLDKGGVDIISKEGIKFLSLAPGKIFGEIGFLNGALRAASIVSNKKSTMFSLSLKDFEMATAEVFNDSDLADLAVIREAFEPLRPSPEEMAKVVALLKSTMYKFHKKEIICSAATKQKFFYIVIRGNVRLSSPNNSMKEVEELGHNDFFGEIAIISETEQTCEQCAQASGQGDTVVCKVSEADFNGLLLPVKELLTKRMSNSRKQHHKREMARQTLGKRRGGGDAGDSEGSDILSLDFSDTPKLVTNCSAAVLGGGKPSAKYERVTEEVGDTASTSKDCSPTDCLPSIVGLQLIQPPPPPKSPTAAAAAAR